MSKIKEAEVLPITGKFKSGLVYNFFLFNHDEHENKFKNFTFYYNKEGEFTEAKVSHPHPNNPDIFIKDGQLLASDSSNTDEAIPINVEMQNKIIESSKLTKI